VYAREARQAFRRLPLLGRVLWLFAAIESMSTLGRLMAGH